MLRSRGVFRWNANILCQPFVVRNYKTDTAFEIDTPDHTMGVAFQHLDDGAFPASAAVNAHDMGNYPIIVEYATHLPR